MFLITFSCIFPEIVMRFFFCRAIFVSERRPGHLSPVLRGLFFFVYRGESFEGSKAYLSQMAMGHGH